VISVESETFINKAHQPGVLGFWGAIRFVSFILSSRNLNVHQLTAERDFRAEQIDVPLADRRFRDGHAVVGVLLAQGQPLRSGAGESKWLAATAFSTTSQGRLRGEAEHRAVVEEHRRGKPAGERGERVRRIDGHLQNRTGRVELLVARPPPLGLVGEPLGEVVAEGQAEVAARESSIAAPGSR